MSIYDDLRIAYRASQETYREYARNSLGAAQELAHSFREHIGAPETYADPDGETRRPYVHLLSFQIPEGVPTAVQPESQNDILTREPDQHQHLADIGSGHRRQQRQNQQRETGGGRILCRPG